MNENNLIPEQTIEDINADHWALIDAILEVNIRYKQLGKTRLERLTEILDRLELEKRSLNNGILHNKGRD